MEKSEMNQETQESYERPFGIWQNFFKAAMSNVGIKRNDNLVIGLSWIAEGNILKVCSKK